MESSVSAPQPTGTEIPAPQSGGFRTSFWVGDMHKETLARLDRLAVDLRTERRIRHSRMDAVMYLLDFREERLAEIAAEARGQS